jgi:hypothetical protein
LVINSPMSVHMNSDCIHQRVFAAATYQNRACTRSAPHCTVTAECLSQMGTVDQQPTVTGMCSRDVGLEGWSSCLEYIGSRETQLQRSAATRAERCMRWFQPDIIRLEACVQVHMYMILMENPF